MVLNPLWRIILSFCNSHSSTSCVYVSVHAYYLLGSFILSSFVLIQSLLFFLFPFSCPRPFSLLLTLLLLTNFFTSCKFTSSQRTLFTSNFFLLCNTALHLFLTFFAFLTTLIIFVFLSVVSLLYFFHTNSGYKFDSRSHLRDTFFSIS